MVYRKIVLTILLLIIGVCFLIADNNNGEWTVLVPEEYKQYLLSSEMIQTYSDQANNGDGDAAHRLGMFYRIWEGDLRKAIYWFEKGIELNNMNCLFEFGTIFMFSNIEYDQIIALQCFNPIIQEAEKGNEEAAKYVSKLPDDIKEAAKNVDNIPDEIKEAAAKEMDKLLDEIKREFGENNE